MKRDPLRQLLPLCRLADLREREAQRRLQAERQQLAQRHQRQAELENYLQDYERSKPTGDALQLENRSRFVKRLHEAAVYQSDVVAQAQSACDEQLQHWREQARNQKLYAQLADQHRRRARAEAERRLQRTLDELATTRASRRTDAYED